MSNFNRKNGLDKTGNAKRGKFVERQQGVAYSYPITKDMCEHKY